MAQSAISGEINRHVEAVLALSKREILLRLLREAELCIELEQVSAAAILAGIAVEELHRFSDLSVLRQHEQSFDVWRDLRNRAAHPASDRLEMDAKLVAEMVSGIRILLDQIDTTQNRYPNFGEHLTKIRGKYAFVPTSVDDFLKRKREDLEREHRE